MSSKALQNFRKALLDSQHILALYESEHNNPMRTIPEHAEVLKRACLILAVTAWETYVEDLFTEQVPGRIDAAKSPEEFQKAFDQVAKRWLQRSKEDQAKTLLQWTGDGWKRYLQDFFISCLTSLHTPNSTNLSKLFSLFLNVDLQKHWAWHPYKFDAAAKRLDDIIKLRGQIAHRSRTEGTNKHPISHEKLVSYLKFLAELATNTDLLVA